MFFGVQDQSKNSGLSTSETAEGASDIGSLLCATRMRLGKDLQDVAAVLRIRYTYLVAIEDGRYEDLPGLAYALGFVRAYADYLGLDGDQVVRRFKEESAGIAPAKVYEFPVRAADNGIPSGALLLMAMVMGVFSYGSWYGLTASDRSPVELIQKAPQHLAALLGPRVQEPVTPSAGSAIAGETVTPSALDMEAPVIAEAAPEALPQTLVEDEPLAVTDVQTEPPATPEVTEVEAEIELAAPAPVPPVEVAPQIEPAVVEPTVVARVETEPAEELVEAAPAEELVEAAPESQADPAPVQETPPVIPAAAEQAPTAETEVAEMVEETPAVDISDIQSAEPEPVAAPEQVAALPTGPAATIELEATADSWIQVRDGDDLVLTRLLREGEKYTVPAQTGLTLMTGNAGGLTVLVDGEVMPPLGDEGVVRRGVPLTSEYFRGLSQESEG